MFISDDPSLFKEWNFEKNKEISPYDTTLGSNKRRAPVVMSGKTRYITDIKEQVVLFATIEKS